MTGGFGAPFLIFIGLVLHKIVACTCETVSKHVLVFQSWSSLHAFSDQLRTVAGMCLCVHEFCCYESLFCNSRLCLFCRTKAPSIKWMVNLNYVFSKSFFVHFFIFHIDFSLPYLTLFFPRFKSRYTLGDSCSLKSECVLKMYQITVLQLYSWLKLCKDLSKSSLLVGRRSKLINWYFRPAKLFIRQHKPITLYWFHFYSQSL